MVLVGKMEIHIFILCFVEKLHLELGIISFSSCSVKPTQCRAGRNEPFRKKK